MRPRHRKTGLPRLWLVTDPRIDDARLIRAAASLPRGAGILFRHRDAPGRRQLFASLQRIAARRRLTLVLAGDARQAIAWGADGFHNRDRPGPKRLLHTAPVHDLREIRLAERHGADLLFLSPLFPTRSHPGVLGLGIRRFAGLARQAQSPVVALGGVNRSNRRRLRSTVAHGWAAIDGLTGQGLS